MVSRDASRPARKGRDLSIADADAWSTHTGDDEPLAAYQRALEELIVAAQALYTAWGRVLVANPPEMTSLLAHLTPAWAERIAREADDRDVVHEALLVATYTLSGIADELRSGAATAAGVHGAAARPDSGEE
jgi:hypothetical protein